MILRERLVAEIPKVISDPSGGPATSASAVTELVGRLQDIVFAAAGAIAVAMLIWGSIILLTAGGNEERTTKGKKTLTWAIGGILFILFSYVLLNFFIRILGGSAT